MKPRCKDREGGIVSASPSKTHFQWPDFFQPCRCRWQVPQRATVLQWPDFFQLYCRWQVPRPGNSAPGGWLSFSWKLLHLSQAQQWKIRGEERLNDVARATESSDVAVPWPHPQPHPRWLTGPWLRSKSYLRPSGGLVLLWLSGLLWCGLLCHCPFQSHWNNIYEVIYEVMCGNDKEDGRVPFSCVAWLLVN